MDPQERLFRQIAQSISQWPRRAFHRSTIRTVHRFCHNAFLIIIIITTTTITITTTTTTTITITITTTTTTLLAFLDCSVRVAVGYHTLPLQSVLAGVYWFICLGMIAIIHDMFLSTNLFFVCVCSVHVNSSTG